MADLEKINREDGDDWPYPVDYEKENIITTDILIIGGGVAGCHAAIAAANKGVKVAVTDKGTVIRSGSGGAGVDHWLGACTNPACQITPDEMIEELKGHVSTLFLSEFGSGPTSYILFREGYDALLDIERFGVKVRDVDDEFAGAPFRDEKSKLLFAYDLKNRHGLRIMGENVKPALFKELKRLEVDIFNRVMITSLLTEDGKQGPDAKVIGATGFNVLTGEFYIFKSKAVILTTGPSLKLWVFSTELAGNNSAHEDPNCVGDGNAIAWNAGAEFTLMEASSRTGGGFRWPAYGTGNAHNTWFGCNIVDARGKEVPWVDRDGNPIETFEGRFQPAPGQKTFVHFGGLQPYRVQGPRIIPDLGERIKNGEYRLPFYADLPGIPEKERRAIFGLMIGNEGKTRVSVYEAYTKEGFDPDKDMLQANILPPDEAGEYLPPWKGSGPAGWRDVAFCGGGGVVFDWNLKTTLDGLYAAGNQLAGGSNHAGAASTGRYAGRNAAEHIKHRSHSEIDRKQVDKEKARVYAPVKRSEGIGWKELQAGLCRVMQDYCGEYRAEESLNVGLEWFKTIRESEVQKVIARNPHELARSLECISRLTVGEMMMHASLARKSSSKYLDFKRMDFPEMDPPEWEKFVTVRIEDGRVIEGELPADFWLKGPNAPTYKENYEKNARL